MAGKKRLWLEPVLGRSRERLIHQCQEALRRGQGESFIYLVSTRPLLDSIVERILDGDRVRAAGDLRVFLFDGLVRFLLFQSGDRRRIIEDAEKFFFLERTVMALAAAGELKYLQAIATLPGCLESLARIIGEIKRADMTADAFEALVRTAAEPHPRDLDLVLIYRRYAEELHRYGLLDADDAYLCALDLFRRRPELPPGLQSTRMLFIDGFFDFTPIQKKLLRYLIERIPEVTVTLTFDPANPSVFHIPLQDTLAFFSSLGEPLETEQMMETEAFHPALVALRRGLFHPDAVPSHDRPPICVFSGATFSHEVEEIAREVKRLVGEQGYRPREIAVIARAPAYLQAVGEELDRRGVPATLGVVEPLLSVPSVKAAVKVLDCRANHAITEPYLALLKNDYLHSFTELDRDAVENAMVAVGIELPIPPFRQRLRSVERIKHYQAQTLTSRLVDLEEIASELARLKRGQMALAAARESLSGMRRALAEIPPRGTLSEMIGGFRRALAAFGLRERLEQRLIRAGNDEQELRLLARDLRGLQALDSVLDELSVIARGDSSPEPSLNEATAASSPAAKITVEQFRDLLTHLLQRSEFKTERGHPDGVYLLEVTQARGLAFRVVFIPGLIEGEFPRSPERDWVYPEAERRRLADAGLFLEDLSPRTFEAKEEHFFYHAACQATERLYLSFPRADAKGEATIVSSFIEDVRQLYAGDEEAPQTTIALTERDLSTYDVRQAASPPEMRRALVASFSHTTPDDALVLHLYQHALEREWLSPTIFPRLRSEAERDAGLLGPFDGVLIHPLIRQQLATRFGPDHMYSASQLTTYGRCPFQFFCRRILQLERREEAALDLVALDRGYLLHAILHDFFERHAHAPLRRERQSEYERELVAVADAIFARYEETALPIHRGLWELEKARITDTLLRFLDAEIAYQQKVAAHEVHPHWLELGFGMSPEKQERCHPASRRTPLVFERPGRAGDRIQIRGRMDRVDRSADGKYIVYDYKSRSGARLAEMREGSDLQIQLYIHALARVFLQPGEEVIGGGYYVVEDGNRRQGAYRRDYGDYTGIHPRAESNLAPEEWQALLDGAERYVWEYVEGMRRGDFRVQPKSDACCPRCDYRTVCRYDKHRQSRADTPGRDSADTESPKP